VDVLGTFEVLSVGSSALALELRFHKSDRDVKEDVEVWDRQIELTVFCDEDPFPKVVGFLC
jgi:hypothetical protein